MSEKSSANSLFFIGWSNKIAPTLKLFLGSTITLLCLFMAVSALFLSRGSDNFGAGLSVGEVTVKGTLELTPIPVLRLDDSTHTILLSGDGKYGLSPDVLRQGAGHIEVTGYMLKRGTIDMLQLAEHGAVRRLENTSAPAPRTTPKSLGRWKLNGEICDGKCYVGAMKPGKGLSHKACANLCLSGGVPPVFVTGQPVNGLSFMLLTTQDRGPLPPRFYDLVARPVELEGELEMLDDVAVFRTDFAKAKTLD